MVKSSSIQNLTEDQIRHLDKARQRQIAAMTSTQRLDRDAVHGAIQSLYECAGKPAPSHVLFAQSPTEAMWICAHLAERDGFGEAHLSDMILADLALIKKGDMGNFKLARTLASIMHDKLDTQYMKAKIASAVHTQVHEALQFMEGHYLIQKTAPNRANSPIKTALADRRGVPSFKLSETDQVVLAIDCDLLAAPNLANLMAKFAYFYDTHGLFEDGRGLFDVALHCGSVWAFENIAVVSERPVEILYDMSHPEPWTLPAPSVAFADGTRL